MANVQRWVHISRKYTRGLTKIPNGSKEQSLSWGIQNSEQNMSGGGGEPVVCRQGHGLIPQRQVLRLGHTQGLAPGHSRREAKQRCRHWAMYLQPNGCCCHVRVATHPMAGRINKGDESEAVKIHFLSIWSLNQAIKGGILARMRKEKAEGSECYRKHQWNTFGRRRRRNTYI